MFILLKLSFLRNVRVYIFAGCERFKAHFCASQATSAIKSSPPIAPNTVYVVVGAALAELPDEQHSWGASR